MISKEELRAQMRGRLAALDDVAVRAASAAVWERLATLPAFADAERLLVYVSKGHEIDTHGLLQQLLALGRQVCVPAFDETQQCYLAAELHEFSELQPGKFGILEPRGDRVRRVRVKDLAATVVPGLAFTRAGDRLGRGLGYFDRILTGTGDVKIALAFACQIVERIPAQAHDVRVDYLVTENEQPCCGKEPS